jgi:ATP-dependent Lhr-like helicase
VPGRWFSLVSGDPLTAIGEDAEDALDAEELDRRRVRLLLQRWGVLARPLLEREEPAFSWGRLLPAMRRLELAGELTAGRFFSGIDSLQFASPDIGRELEAAEAETGIYWMNAADPASPAGLGIGGLDAGSGAYPPRLTTSRLCFRGSALIAVSTRNGRDLRLFIPPEDSDLPEALGFLGVQDSRGAQSSRAVSRPGGGRKKVLIETINGTSAAQSPYADTLKALGFLPDRSYLVLW